MTKKRRREQLKDLDFFLANYRKLKESGFRTETLDKVIEDYIRELRKD